LFAELKSARPKSVAAINGLVRAAFFLDEFETAEKYLRELETIQGPQGTLTELALASLFEANRNPTKVEEWFKKGLEREDNEPIRREYAKWLIRNNRAEEAKEMATNTKPSEGQKNEFVFIVALSEQMLGNFAASEPILARLDKVKPDTFPVMNHLVWAMLASKDAETRKAALQLANRAVSKFPLSMEAVATLGWAFHKNGNSQMGEEVFDRPTSSKNLSRDAAYFLAQIKEAVGKKEESEQILAGIQKAEGEFFHAKMLSAVSPSTPSPDAK
jgi:predicted Zn-dependent protease